MIWFTWFALGQIVGLAFGVYRYMRFVTFLQEYGVDQSTLFNARMKLRRSW